MVATYNINSPLNRQERTNLNDSLDDAKNRLISVQRQINTLAGGTEVENLLKKIEETVNNGSASVEEIQRVIDNGNEYLNSFQQAETNIQQVIDSGNQSVADNNREVSELVIRTEAELAGVVNDTNERIQEITGNVDQLTSDLAGYNIPIQNFNLSSGYIVNQAVRFNGTTYRAKVATQNNPLPNNSQVENEWWTLEAQRGVDGNGAVSSVSGISPTIDGNVTITPQDIDALGQEHLLDNSHKHVRVVNQLPNADTEGSLFFRQVGMTANAPDRPSYDIILEEINDIQKKVRGVINIDEYENLKVGNDWTVAIQTAIRENIGEITFNPSVRYGVSETIYTKNDVTLVGLGHSFGVQIHALPTFYSNSNNFVVNGLPVVFAASTNGYNQAIKRTSHFKIRNLHILSRPWQEFTQGAEFFNGRLQSIGIHGTFFEGNFEDVSCSGFQIAFDVNCNNTKFIGAAIALGNGVTYSLSGNGGSVIQTSSVLGDIAVHVKRFSSGISFTGFHTESSLLPFQIDEHCQNISITTPHIFNYRGEAFKIHPSSKVIVINGDITNYSIVDGPDSEISKVTYLKNERFKQDYGLINHVPDGRLTRKDSSAWTATNGNLVKSPRNLEVFAKGVISSEYDNIMSCMPTDNSFTITNRILSTGFLDFEFYANTTQAIRMVIQDNSNSVLLDTGFVSGEVDEISANSIKQLPTKICGALPPATATPISITITCQSAQPFVITKLCVYNGEVLRKASGTAIFAETGENYRGFKEYKISGANGTNLQTYVANPRTSDGYSRYKLAGFLRSDFLKSENFRVRDNTKTNPENYVRSLYNGFAYTETEYTTKNYLNLLKTSENDSYCYGLGTVSMFPKNKDGNFMFSNKPTFGYWEVGDRIENISPTAGGYSGWVCVAQGYGNDAQFKGYGIIEN